MRFPVLWLAAAYAAGLALYADVDDSPRVLFLLAIGFLLAGGVALWRRWLRATLALALGGFLLAGGAAIGLSAGAVDANRLDRLLATDALDLSEAVRLTGWLRRTPERKPFALIYELEVESVAAAGREWPTSGGARLAYFLPTGESPEVAPPPLAYGDRVEILTRVHQPINHQNPGSFDWRGYLAGRELFLEGSLKSPLLLKKLAGRRGRTWRRWMEATRAHLLARLDWLAPPQTRADQNAVLRAMLLGDLSFLSHRVSDDFRLSGTYHVLVISGLHVAVIALFVFWLLRRLRASEVAATLLTLAVLLFYLLLVEERAPIERAVWMVLLYMLARRLYRRVHLANPLALAALVILFLHPAWLFEASFHFTFAAVLLIAFFAVPWTERTSAPYRQALGFLDAADRDDLLRPPRLAQFRHDLRATAELLRPLVFWTRDTQRGARRLLTSVVRTGLRVWEFLVLSFAIHLGLLLLTVLYFQRVILTGLLANVLVVPLVSFLVPLGFGLLLLALLWPALAAIPGWVLLKLTGGLLVVVGLFAGGGISYGIPPPPAWLAVWYAATLGVLGVAVAYRRHHRWAAAALALPLLLVITHPFPPRPNESVLEVTVLDVGQGDSLFLAFPNGETWLLDGGRGPVQFPGGYWVGEAPGQTVVAPYLRLRGLKRLDRVWLSHAHHDHMAGLTTILEEFAVGSFHTGPTPASEAYERLLEAARRHDIPVVSHTAGERFRVGAVEVAVLWPPRDREAEAAPSNNDSLVLRLCLAETCVLLPGDIEADIEKTLAAEGTPLSAAVLKVPHHGGRDAASEEFLAAVRPQAAIVSVGATNPFGHPYAAVLERLEAQGLQTFRTDHDGSVTVRVRSGAVQVESYRQRKPAGAYASVGQKLAACLRTLLWLESP